MHKLITKILLSLIIAFGSASAQVLFIPMDFAQTDHLKAYGIAFRALEMGINVEWLLNYRAGSFAMETNPELENLCIMRGVYAENITTEKLSEIYQTINSENMERVILEKVPAIAVYSPNNVEPWDDAVTLALTHADIKYDLIWDEEVLAGVLEEYDWLHLHHEDFTGQYGKFYASFRNQLWYRQRISQGFRDETGSGQNRERLYTAGRVCFCDVFRL